MEETIILPAAINVNFNSHSKCYQYRLIIYNSKLSHLLIGKKERAKLVKKDGEFFLFKDDSGNVLNPSPKHQTTFMSLGKMSPEIRSILTFDKKSNTLKIKIKLEPSKWGLNKLDVFLETKEERDLADKLIQLGYIVRPVTYNDENKFGSACADLILENKKDKIPIEITTTAPSKSKALGGINSPHGHQWTKVSGRITPLIIYSVEKKVKSFMIINKEWENYPHVNYMMDKLKRINCYILLSTFSDNWDDKIANEINKMLYTEK